MLKILASVFACTHRNQSFPQTDRRTKQTTVTCCDCGRIWLYDWNAMRRGPRIPLQDSQAAPVSGVLSLVGK